MLRLSVLLDIGLVGGALALVAAVIHSGAGAAFPMMAACSSAEPLRARMR